MKVPLTHLLASLLLAAPLGAQESFLQRLDDSLRYRSPGGLFRSELSGLVDLEAYFVDQRPPGLLFGSSDFFNPRLSLFLDTHFGEQFYSLVQFRADRGFDPRLMPDGDARFDEYLLRWKTVGGWPVESAGGQIRHRLRQVGATA